MSQVETTVFYDGGCKVCSWEIEGYRRKDIHGNLRFVDIDEPEFKAESHGLDPERVRRVLHVKKSDGSWATGVEAFSEIWSCMDRPVFKFLARASGFPVVRPILNLGYQAFIRVRPWLPRKDCESGACSR